MPVTIDEEQGSQSWLDFRLSGIGGSDAAIIASYFMATPYTYGNWPGSDLYKLWCNKTGRIPQKPSKDQSFGDYVDPKEHGKTMEPIAREWWMMETGSIAPPAVLQHDIVKHCFASLDGYEEGAIAAEIKCPKEPGDHRKAKEGEIPHKYLAQLHHNYFVAAAPEFHFVSYYAGEGIIIPFKPDPKFMDELREGEEEFWRWVVSKEFPVPRGAIETTDPEWLDAITGFFELQVLEREVDAKMKIQKLQIMRIMARLGGGKVSGGGGRASLNVRGKSMVPAFERQEFLSLMIQPGGERNDGD